MTREIGSEFHSTPFENGHGIKFPRLGSQVFSGRTAIEYVLKENPNARTALLPSYCCDSMVMPFRDAGIDVSFYDVNWDSGMKTDIRGTADILLWCNYFGYKNNMPDFNGIIIEDITHSLFSEEQCHKNSDYLVASLRKWEPVNCGGYCSIDVDGKEPPAEFVNNKADAMKLKTQYLSSQDEKMKPVFLSKFSKSNQWLEKHYSGLSIDEWSREYLNHIDMEMHRKKRRDNAKVLYDGLRDKIQFLFPEQDMDCPLFVPVLIPKRDEIRQKLNNEKIYCPIHWPKPENCDSNLYSMELSLVCDQRYDKNDMERIVSVLLKLI